jgi:signal transduction histidine kinase
LALAHAAIVNRHQGQLWFESEPGQGTTFFIRLPLETGALES